ncbi:MAG: transketolase [Bacteroidales bacterium]|jgi:transketolase|nr:transketolase [Bacteroidales bacterium]
MTQKNIVERSANNMRILSMAMVEKAKSGHPGGAMGGMDFINILYSEFLNYDPTDTTWHNRDRFFLDPGHMSPMLYSVLCMAGILSINDIEQFRQWGSLTPGHPEANHTLGIENTSGPLGQGHTMAVGAAIAEKFLTKKFGEWQAHKIYTFISDGGIQEEISQGAGRIAGHLGLNNLIMFFDSNDIQLSTKTNEVSSENTAAKYEAWGWRTITINGNNADEIRAALKAAGEETERPTLIIGKTTMGKGLVDEQGNSFERKTSTHGQPVSKAGASVAKSIENLGGNPAEPFAIFADVKDFWAQVREEKIRQAQAKKQLQTAWEAQNPVLAQQRADFYAGKLPEINYESIAHGAGIATRVASRNILSEYAQKIENMFVSSADLSNSDNTDGFLKHTKSFQKGDYSGRFIEAGVSELTMAAVLNGMILHGGVHAACGTFFVFSEYMKPAMRMSALMELPVKYIWSHDAFRVGEDGPTHQPIEQEAQVRLMEQVHNHSGKRSFLVLRPADATETTVCWKMAMETTDRPVGLILSRQVIKDLPARTNSTRYTDALQAYKGAYIVNEPVREPDLILVANGSEVSTIWEGAQILEQEHGLCVQIVSAPSEGLFRDQSAEYQEKVLPSNKPILGFTAGLAINMRGLVGAKGKIWGLNHFGYSAPFEVLDEKFGYTKENVVKQALEYLQEYK